MQRITWAKAVIVISTLLFMGLLLVNSSNYTNLISQRIIRISQERGVSLQITDSRRRGLGFEFEGLSSVIPLDGFYILLSLDSLWLRPSYLSLLTGTPKLFASSNAYGGKLTVDGFSSWSGQEGSADIVLQKLNLPSHKQIEGFGIRSGYLSISASGVEWDSNALKSVASTELSIDNLSMPDPIDLPKGSLGLPLELRIPSLTEGNLNAFIDYRESTLSISDIDFSSSWGKINGSFKAQYFANRFRPVHVSLNIKLNDESLDYFGPLFQLMSQGKTNLETKNLKIRADKLGRISVLPG